MLCQVFLQIIYHLHGVHPVTDEENYDLIDAL